VDWLKAFTSLKYTSATCLVHYAFRLIIVMEVPLFSCAR